MRAGRQLFKYQNVFLRIGPNPIDELDRVRLVRHHWFAGTGMAHGLRLREGKTEWFRGRFVLDRDGARALSRKPFPGPGEGTRNGNVDTNLMNAGGKLCAVVEAGGIPVELDLFACRTASTEAGRPTRLRSSSRNV